MIDAKEYGKALFLLTEEDGTTKAVAEELRAVQKLLRENPRYEKLLDTPALSKEEKLQLIDRAFSSMNESLVNLLKILCEKHSVYRFSGVADAYAALYDESRGIERACLARRASWTPVLCSSVEKAALGVLALVLVSRRSRQPLQGAQCPLGAFLVQPFIVKTLSFVRRCFASVKMTLRFFSFAVVL